MVLMKYFLGITLFIFALFIIGNYFIPVFTTELNYDIARLSSPTEIKQVIPVDTEFGIIIPKIYLNSKITADVDPLNLAESQKAFSVGLAQAHGSSLPGRNGDIFIFSNLPTRYFLPTSQNANFYLINKLEKNDSIEIYYQDKKYIYTVQDKQIIVPDDVRYFQIEESKEQTLTLMTCWPPGTSQNRLLIHAINQEQK